MANEPDAMTGFTKAAGIALMACGISLFAMTGGAALSAGSAAGLSSSFAASALGTATGYTLVKAPEWTSAPT
jgi:ribose/xylose/arabinose/galactoside ABC-type transport system permease subunit